MASPGIKFNGDLLNFLRKQGLLDPHKTLPGNQSVRLNVSARSIIVKYDLDGWQPQWVDKLLTTQDPDRFRIMLNEFTG
jgi:hypothetical protein